MFYQKKGLLEKAAKIKRFKHSPLDNELKKHLWHCKRSL